MKIVYTTLALATIIFISSCGSREKSLSKFYREVNNRMKSEALVVKSNTQTLYSDPNFDSKSINSSVESSQVKSKYDEYKVKYADSEYANGDVYVEAVKHRQKRIQQEAETQKSTTKPPASDQAISSPHTAQNARANVSSTNNTQTRKESKNPDFFAHLLDADKNLIRTEGGSYMNEEDRTKIKRYSVIVASLAKYEGVERLKKIFGNKESLIITKNDMGLYNVIIGTYDTEAQALEKIRTLKSQYRNRYSATELQKKFGIPFSDLWIMRK